MGEEDTKGAGFTVVDRRGSAEPEPPPAQQPDADAEQPRVDFSGFCLSLATSALYHMGVAVHPESRDKIPEANLPLAQQTIDMLEMLQVKTRGNLDEEEARLLESMLYELRMRFVEVRRGGSAGSEPGE
jgi:hypothetical protein